MLGDYELFKNDFLKLSELDLSFYKERQMKRRINSFISRKDHSTYKSFFNSLTLDKKLYDEFINYLTINVSEFFRNPTQWDVLEREILPHLFNYSSTLKVWSAACSTGEEPYSLVMLLSKFLDLNKIKVLATDIDTGAIDKAKLGLYSEKSLSNLPKDFISKYFKKINNSFKISEKIKNCVQFEQQNLLRDTYPLNCDLIVCRNVLIYFTEDAKDIIYKNFHNSLSEHGILFVGSTEQIIMSQKYKLKPVKTFFYKKVKKDIET